MALELASQAAARGEVPVGAVVVTDQGFLAGASHNNREESNDPTGHAELIAIKQASQELKRWRLSDCTLYVTLEPCPMCAGALVNARIKRVVYGAKDPKSGAIESLFKIANDPRLNHRAEVVGGILEASCAKVIQDFFRAKRSNQNEK